MIRDSKLEQLSKELKQVVAYSGNYKKAAVELNLDYAMLYRAATYGLSSHTTIGVYNAIYNAVDAYKFRNPNHFPNTN